MRLSAETGAINQDLRDQLLRDIQYGRELQAATNKRVATIPAGRPTPPFNSDQAAYDAALKGFQQSDPAVTALEKRLTEMPGPYWKDLTAQERDAMALWTESLKQMDTVSKSHYPTSLEMDIKKAILLAIGVGALFGPLLFTEASDAGFPFRVLPKPPELPFERAPMTLPRPVRTEAPALPYRASNLPATPVTIRRTEETASPIPSVVSRPGYTAPTRFSRGFTPGSSPSAAAPVAAPASGGGLSMRPGGGERRFIYPKPRTS